MKGGSTFLLFFSPSSLAFCGASEYEAVMDADFPPSPPLLPPSPSSTVTGENDAVLFFPPFLLVSCDSRGD